MIPTMILFGLISGRWWKTSMVVGTLAWPLLLLATEIIQSPPEVLGAAGLGLVNTLAGVVVHQLALRLVRFAYRHRTAPARHRA